MQATKAKRTATEAEIGKLITYRDALRADLEGKPAHMLNHQWGIDRRREIEATNRQIETLLRSR